MPSGSPGSRNLPKGKPGPLPPQPQPSPDIPHTLEDLPLDDVQNIQKSHKSHEDGSRAG